MPVARQPERGSGLLSSAFGVAIVMCCVGVAANVALGLWTRTTVDAVAYDAARDVATAPEGDDLQARAARAVETARRLLGPHGAHTELTFESLGPRTVVLHVRSPGVALLPRLVRGGPTVGTLDRRIALAREGGVP
jgi:hypothetical protein